MPRRPPYRRVLVKLSGEAFCAEGGLGIDPQAVAAVVAELAAVHQMQVQVAVVAGGGNLMRGRTAAGGALQRTTADAMGMLATVMNALALRDALEHHGTPAHVLTALPTAGVAETFSRRRAAEHLDAQRVVVLAGGTGHPFFTTDTCAALRASEIDADVLLKATKVDGVFEADPLTHPSARKFDRLTYGEALARQLGVMDLAAVSLCMASRIPVIVFRLATPGNLAAAVRGEPVGTIISAE